MNNDNDLNLYIKTKMSGWLRYWFDLDFELQLNAILIIIIIQNILQR